ncbi:MAG: hypothetical protein QM698_10060 [Micropepsaceae bacterium]
MRRAVLTLALGLAGTAMAHERLEDARRDVTHARIAVKEISRDLAKIEAGDFSGSLTIEGGDIVKCGDPAKYPELNCAPYSDAEKAEMLAEMRSDLADAEAELAKAEADLKAAETEAKASVTDR